MKTRGLTVMSMLLLNMMTGGQSAGLGTKPPSIFHSHGSSHKRGKLKGWMKENKKCSFNKNR